MEGGGGEGGQPVPGVVVKGRVGQQESDGLLKVRSGESLLG